MTDRNFTEAIAGLAALSDDEFYGLRFIDVEASGLHKTSYPIEIAWCGPDLKPVSMLLRPLPQWGIEDWNPESERVHGISRETLLQEGIDARECAEAMAEALRGREVFSDAPQYDARWMMRMFAETGVRPGFDLRSLEDAQALCVRRSDPPIGSMQEMMQVLEDVDRHYRHTHRAGDDCLRMAAQCRALADVAWRGELGKTAGDGRPSRS